MGDLINGNSSHYAMLRSPCLNDGKALSLYLQRWSSKAEQGAAMTVEFEGVLLNNPDKDREWGKPFDVRRILQSGNRVIVFWSDGTKTIVKRSDDTDDDIYGAFTAALAIKVYGSNSQVNRIIDRKHEHIDKVNGKPYVVSDYEKRKRVRKWMKEKQKHEQKSDQ